MRTDELLNPSLYRLLTIHFGSVDVVSPGQALIWSQDSALATNTDQGSRQRLISGEEYRVNCPFCNDTRGRLYINHRWAVFDQDMQAINLWLCQCWNEQCMENYHNRVVLHERVFSPAPDPDRLGRMRVKEGRKTPNSVSEVSPPGPLFRVDGLKERQPHHAAVTFLEDRDFDPILLGRRYGVAYCGQSHYSLASHRIIIPVWQGGRLVGWQARYIGDPPKGVPKYWTCPGMCLRMLAYNYERAIQHHTIIVVEGPTDVWRVGAQAMGLMGKSINPMFAKRMVDDLRKTNDGDHTVVVLLDPEMHQRDIDKGKRHHIDVVTETLELALGEHGMDVLPVYLPEGLDPGGMDRGAVRERVIDVARENNMRVSFARPKKCQK